MHTQTEIERLSKRLHDTATKLDASQREASRLLSCLSSCFIEELMTVEPRPVVRDAQGLYTNPTYPIFPEATPPSLVNLWKEHHALETSIDELPDELREMNTEFDDFVGVRAWNPAPPDGEGWFLGGIHDTEDGTFAVWVRNLNQTKRQRDLVLIDIFSSDGKTIWSKFQEHFDDCYSLAELLQSRDELKAGDVVYRGTVRIPDIESFAKSNSALDEMACAACEVAGEAADEFPCYSDEDRARLDRSLKGWVQSIGHPTWFCVADITPYTISQADIDSAQESQK